MKGDTLILALADLSGSMTGEPISKMNVQLTELLSELQMMQDHAEGTIYFCLEGFHEKVQSLVEPTPVCRLNGVPHLQVARREDGYFARTRLGLLLGTLGSFLIQTGREFEAEKTYILLFSDGFPTDAEQTLRNCMEEMRKYSDAFYRCRRYVIREKERRVPLNARKNFWKEFAGAEEKVFQAQCFSEMTAQLYTELTVAEEDDVFG